MDEAHRTYADDTRPYGYNDDLDNDIDDRHHKGDVYTAAGASAPPGGAGAASATAGDGWHVHNGGRRGWY